MKLRNNYNVGDRILILHANTKNQLRKNDIGKIGTILDKRCSFCVVHLDGDDRDKNYNYGTFAKITKVTLDQGPDLPEQVGSGSLIDAMFTFFRNRNPKLVDVSYRKDVNKWVGKLIDGSDRLIGTVLIEVNNKLNEKFPDEANNIQERGEE